MSKIVIALGGNALGKNPSEQLLLLKNVAKIIVNLVKDGNKIVLTHGNGPQVGQIALAMEYASNGEAGTPMMPFPECGSMSQGYIGYQLQQVLENELKNRQDKLMKLINCSNDIFNKEEKNKMVEKYINEFLQALNMLGGTCPLICVLHWNILLTFCKDTLYLNKFSDIELLSGHLARM